ncbi:type II toxin-antitoxin system RatA family toxin [Rhodobacter capsulatus]|jgi:coenzyme Q-binding protein COQ10|uniref:Cyclase/dehydrase family protein n=1 Tax=Rhodobacter capsulatus (strain ATCC BAA-309 / NBRC 16581 / SB1003) TaxID=272942 RepID=D5AU97_RHOCB|nr:type II toxin-antitoxin system RatA family toxin [Rhodobacter capsulatus]ADE85536.1 cyclase/dehydrase family protein [Rhodobacter capsulatus SB 1003]ETD81222.1 cyclase [Rhodobacter capsulatus B6]MDS0927248.1 type II toxin-antitoxin system RatA family toxin [Rhodobacter capsulatus]TQD35219.1 type II toxin-antitoxin system RatA family toxin [Rhodobacter capsulatus]
MPRHTEQRFMPYSAAQMYALVADVARYPEFLPWNSAARIRARKPGPRPGTELMEADLVISFKVFRERFGSRVVLDPDNFRVDTQYLDGPFKHMHSWWQFSDRPGGCEVDFFVDFEFKNALLQGVIGIVFDQAMRMIVKAFEDRAIALYGWSGRVQS